MAIEKVLKDGDGFVYPRYDGFSLYNVFPTIFDLFGISKSKKSLTIDGLEEYFGKSKKIVLFVLDGFGYDQFQKFHNKYKVLDVFQKNGIVCPITTVFPSTTATALSTLLTGLAPYEHGLIEWNLYIEEIDKIIQTLPFSDLGRTVPSESLRNENVPASILLEDATTLFEVLTKHGIRCYAFISEEIFSSTFSSLILKGAEKISYVHLSDLVVSLATCVSKISGPAFFYIYWSSIDSQEHVFGPNSITHYVEVDLFFEALQKGFIENVGDSQNEDTLIAMISDHGQIRVEPEETVYLHKDQGFFDLLAHNKKGEKIPPYGSPRDVFMKAKHKKQNEILQYLRINYGKKAKIITVDEALINGLFGPRENQQVSRRFFARAGDILMLPFGNNTIWYEHIKGELFRFLGHHGGLSEKEMIIPFGISLLKHFINY